MKNVMMHFFLISAFFAGTATLFGQNWLEYEPSPEHPFGLLNPEAPKKLMDYAPLIGECKCKSLTRIDQNTWADTVDMVWRWKYIMNGLAVQDETLKADGTYSGSIRQFIPDSARWFVHYYSSAGPTAILPAWEGNTTADGKIILYKDQAAPNGTPGNFKITFDEITEDGFNWLGEWVTKNESFSYPTWKIFCTKDKTDNNEADRARILENVAAFSQAYINADTETIANSYTLDAKIFPMNTGIVAGRAAIKERWTSTDGSKILSHKITPVEIKFLGDYAYDYGYYEGSGQSAKEEDFAFKGKYVIVWKKEDGDWKMYLDIWNRITD